MNKYVTEFIGAFFLVAAIGFSGSALVIGSALMVMVYMGGHISGAHYNPAVTLAVFMRGGKMPASDVVPYIVMQCLGALGAAAVVYLVSDNLFAPIPSADVVPALVAEVLFTFALALVVLNVAFAKDTAGNSYYGLAIGFTVYVGAVAVGDVSGGAFNPAVGVGPHLMNAIGGNGGIEHVWLHIVGPLVGGALGAIVFKMQNPGDV